jgi:hypothetical protein
MSHRLGVPRCLSGGISRGAPDVIGGALGIRELEAAVLWHAFAVVFLAPLITDPDRNPAHETLGQRRRGH